MNAEDFAIVVGIARYPGFGRTETEPRNLNGPDNDAQSVYEWIVSPAGGAVPPGNVTLVKSSAYPAGANAIDALPATQAAVIRLRDIDGWTAEEVRNALDISDVNQRVLLHRARSKVRQALEEYLAP
jgi:RNA polymerase sigma-70 factor (ECF subfamily)